MIKGTDNPWLLVFFVGMSVGYHSTCQAGILNGHVAAYENVAGSIFFNNGAGLSGNIDYAVFTAAAFNAHFGGLGYAPASELVYAFQIENLGSVYVSGETISVANAANTIGTFNIGDVDASSATLTPDAEWSFAPGIAPGDSSWGLAFSSPNLPIVGFFTTFDGDTSWLMAGVPTPGHNPIPEPASLALLAIGSVLTCRRIRRRGA